MKILHPFPSEFLEHMLNNDACLSILQVLKALMLRTAKAEDSDATFTHNQTMAEINFPWRR